MTESNKPTLTSDSFASREILRRAVASFKSESPSQLPMYKGDGPYHGQILIKADALRKKIISEHWRLKKRDTEHLSPELDIKSIDVIIDGFCAMIERFDEVNEAEKTYKYSKIKPERFPSTNSLANLERSAPAMEMLSRLHECDCVKEYNSYEEQITRAMGDIETANHLRNEREDATRGLMGAIIKKAVEAATDLGIHHGKVTLGYFPKASPSIKSTESSFGKF